jgi:hypothetical protein
MDPARQLRFLVAPFFFFSSLLWGYYLSHGLPALEVSGLIAVLVASFFPIGFFIGVLSHLLLKLFFRAVFRHWSEVHLEENALRRIWLLLGVEGAANRAREYYASATTALLLSGSPEFMSGSHDTGVGFK